MCVCVCVCHIICVTSSTVPAAATLRLRHILAASRAAAQPAASLSEAHPSSITRDRTARFLPHIKAPEHECPRSLPPPADPRRCACAPALAQQPSRSARVCAEHTRLDNRDTATKPACLLHLLRDRACRCPPPPPLCVNTHVRALLAARAGQRLNDLYSFSPAANTWTALSPSGSGPSGREGMGFAATPNGLLYVFGGGANGGNEGGGGGVGWGGSFGCGCSHFACTCCDSLSLSRKNAFT